MTCNECEKLMALYERAVRTYTTAARSLSGLLADDFIRAFDEAEKLRMACRAANEVLLEHWRLEHANSPVESDRGVI